MELCKKCFTEQERVLEENNGCGGQIICTCLTTTEQKEQDPSLESVVIRSREKRTVNYGVFPRSYTGDTSDIAQIEEELYVRIKEKVNGFYTKWKVNIPSGKQKCERCSLSDLLVAAAKWTIEHIDKHVKCDMPGLEKGRFAIEAKTLCSVWVEHEEEYLTVYLIIKPKGIVSSEIYTMRYGTQRKTYMDK